MSILRLDRLLEILTSIQLLMAMLWLGLLIFTLAMAVLMYTRWGQYKPLRKCMVLSVLAHLLLAGYAATVQIMGPAVPPQPVVHIWLGDGPDRNAPPGGAAPLLSKAKEQPWEIFPAESAAPPKGPELERRKSDRPAPPERTARAQDSKLAGQPSVDHVALPDAKLPSPKPTTLAEAAKRSTSAEKAAPIDAPPARTAANDAPAAVLERIVPLPKSTDAEAAYGNPSSVTTVSRAAPRDIPAMVASNPSKLGVQETARNVANDARPAVPDAYRLRVAPDRAGVAQSHGGTAETEAAVKAALQWLADHQAADGRWDPRANEAGKEANVAGRNRQGAGSRADTAMTGLALLAFLASGHTHLDGPYRDNLRNGLEFLIQSQAPDGNLGGQAAVFEFMYCHAMAACALSEAYGMTHDARLRDPVRRAIGYTIAAQDPKGGGWRYRSGDPGDTSQLGWQMMALKSADLAGISMPEATRQGIVRYLQSVASGRFGGHASYRPGEQATRSMTAEALVCWQFLGLARENPACDEAGDFIVAETPGEGDYNLYYWYYATLSTYQLQGPHWQRWNEALRTTLVNRQVKDGPLAGTWDADLWGSNGGRVYTTALATLTLEVYYRFLPLYGGVPAVARRP